MANSIDFSEGTEAVVDISTKIDSLGDDFFKEYTDLYELVANDLAACWKGDDFSAFQAKIEGEKHFFESMRDVISEYATFLRNTANAHDARMEDSKEQVSTNVNFE